ncbi:hypothetical protein GUJ93_ZPchr0004g38855, partial [Zizania palustris]
MYGKAAAITSASKWRPRPTNVESLLSNFKEKNDTESAERHIIVSEHQQLDVSFPGCLTRSCTHVETVDERLLTIMRIRA